MQCCYNNYTNLRCINVLYDINWTETRKDVKIQDLNQQQKIL